MRQSKRYNLNIKLNEIGFDLLIAMWPRSRPNIGT
jgi:hypothetical protein